MLRRLPVRVLRRSADHSARGGAANGGELAATAADFKRSLETTGAARYAESARADGLWVRTTITHNADSMRIQVLNNRPLRPEDDRRTQRQGHGMVPEQRDEQGGRQTDHASMRQAHETAERVPLAEGVRSQGV